MLQGGGNVLGLLGGLARAAATARLVAAADIGAYAIALVAIGLAVRAGGLGIASAMYHLQPATTTYRRCLGLGGASGLLAGAIAGLTCAMTLGTEDAWPLALAVGLGAGGQVVAEIAGTQLGLRLAYGPLAAAGAGARTLGDVLAIAAIAWSPDFGGLLIGLGLQGITLAIIFLLADYRNGVWSSGADPADAPGLPAILRLGGITVVDGFITFGIARLDRLIVSHVYGLGTLGYYELVATLAERPLQLVITTVRGVYAPLITRYVGRASALRTVHRSYVGHVGLLMAPATVVALCFGGSLLELLYGRAYGAYWGVYAALVTLAWVKSTGLPIWQHIVATGRMRLSIYVNLTIGALRAVVLFGAALVLPLASAIGVYVTTRSVLALAFEHHMRRRYFATDLRAAAAPLLPHFARAIFAVLLWWPVARTLPSYRWYDAAAILGTGLTYVVLSRRELSAGWGSLRGRRV